MRGLPAAGNTCNHEICITCSDAAVAVRVLKLLDGGRALVRTQDGVEEISIELIEAMAGETVLVHAGVAIGKLDETGDGNTGEG